MGTGNEDLIAERRKCDFDIEELMVIIDGGKEEITARKIIEEKVLKVIDIRNEIPTEYMSHKEKFENAMLKTGVFLNLISEFFIEYPEYTKFLLSPTKVFKVHDAVFKDSSLLIPHFGLFLTTILSQATPEQQMKWMNSGSPIFGSYAQTELGHGTNIKCLETTATYDPETEEFILNTPSLTSYKWWPGGLGNIANHCILMAQLYIKGKCYGPHMFFVQIRDLDTHLPLSGVKVGEIGPKFGFQAINHGFLGLINLRIPRSNMLMKNTVVLKDGSYVKSKSGKSAYGTMVLMRVLIITDVSYEVARAATIAIRYSAVRRQSHIKPEEPEVQILDFVSQQHKLFIALATSHIYRVVGQWLWKTHKSIVGDMKEENINRIPELHALVCCLKAVTSREGTACVEQCRLACGGHGYMMSSNLPTLYALSTASITYEGEYTVMLLQTARYLMKVYKEVTEGIIRESSSTISYLGTFTNQKYKWTNTPAGIIQGFECVASGKVKLAYNSIDKHLRMGKSYEDAWNLASINLLNAAEAHARCVLCLIFWNETQLISSSISKPVGTVLQHLAELYIVYWALEKRADFLLYCKISGDDIAALQERYEELLTLIRPNAVGLVDAFDFKDEILSSTLGAYDGRVYERLMEEAMKSPLNAEPVNQSFHKYLKPILLKNKL